MAATSTTAAPSRCWRRPRRARGRSSRRRWWRWSAATWLLLVTGVALALGVGNDTDHSLRSAGRLGRSRRPRPCGWWSRSPCCASRCAASWALLGWGIVVLFVTLGQIGELLGLPQWVLDLSPYSPRSRGCRSRTSSSDRRSVLTAIAAVLLVGRLAALPHPRHRLEPVRCPAPSPGHHGGTRGPAARPHPAGTLPSSGTPVTRGRSSRFCSSARPGCSGQEPTTTPATSSPRAWIACTVSCGVVERAEPGPGHHDEDDLVAGVPHGVGEVDQVPVLAEVDQHAAGALDERSTSCCGGDPVDQAALLVEAGQRRDRRRGQPCRGRAGRAAGPLRRSPPRPPGGVPLPGRRPRPGRSRSARASPPRPCVRARAGRPRGPR